MAGFLDIERELEEFKRELFYLHSQAEENRLREHQAAVRIQSWFRGLKLRAYLRHLHKKAVIIQKIWRGFAARARFRQMVKEAYFTMKMNFYNEMALRIQRRWRGYLVRKYVHDFYARKGYLEGVIANNDIVRRELDELEELQRRERGCLQMVKEQRAKLYQAHRSHHLLSTKQCPGVFNSPFRQAPHEMEQLLRQVKYQPPTRFTPRSKTCISGMPRQTAPSFPETPEFPWMKTNRSCCSLRPILPPIASKKQQDLLREPGEVWKQRMLCPELTSRLQASYTCLEEAQNQLRQRVSDMRHRMEEGQQFLHLSSLRQKNPIVN